ncbi:MAG TPA: MarR family transcriptional regulator [Actinomycetota bacterium]|nr:MarR family transcriptional regulator [Actinomycetota bacterium]
MAGRMSTRVAKGDREVAEALQRLVVAAVRYVPREISLTAASTLGRVERLGPRRITDLAAYEGVSQPSMTAMVTGLERAGLVARRPDPGDQRAVLVCLTDSGAGYLEALRQDWTETFARLLGQLPPSDADVLLTAAPALRRLQDLVATERDGAPSVSRRVAEVAS